jgi:hypothetical protein
MALLKKIFRKTEKTKDHAVNNLSKEEEQKYFNFLKQRKEQTLNDSMHKIIKETSTGIAF